MSELMKGNVLEALVQPRLHRTCTCSRASFIRCLHCELNSESLMYAIRWPLDATTVRKRT